MMVPMSLSWAEERDAVSEHSLRQTQSAPYFLEVCLPEREKTVCEEALNRKWEANRRKVEETKSRNVVRDLTHPWEQSSANKKEAMIFPISQRRI